MGFVGLAVAVFLTAAVFPGSAAANQEQIERRVAELEKRVAKLEAWLQNIDYTKRSSGNEVGHDVGNGGEKIWNCHSIEHEIRRRAFGEKPKKILTLTAVGDSGAVYVSNMRWHASYSVQGTDRRWDFGPDGSVYAIVMDPDGKAGYYDFTGRRGERIHPKQTYQCQQNK